MQSYNVEVIGNGSSVMFSCSVDAKSKADAEFKASKKFNDNYGFYPSDRLFNTHAEIKL